MKETTKQKLSLGIFMILGSLVFIVAIYFIGNKQTLFGRTAVIYAVFNNVNGLQPGNNVRYSGIDAGTVRVIEMINDTTIRVEMAIERKILKHIKKDAVAAISSDGLVGSMVINIIPGNGNQPVSDGSVIKSYSRIRTEDILKTLNVTNENAALLTADLLKITNKIEQGDGSIGVLLNDTIMASDMKKMLHYLMLTSVETSVSMRKLNRLITSLEKDDGVIGVLKDTVTATKIKSIIVKLDQSGTAMNQAVNHLDGMILEYKEGKGAVNYLVKDSASAQKMDSVINNLNKSSQLLKENLEAIKHNFLLRGYFKKQSKAKAKEMQN
ncbi:MlaD family protein [Flavobacterium terrisoli]|uniref:MlaD family protein n=1 Tax=Flavobacterium terrisoli TaxID=3242195 RepID=UPI002543B5BF|nr:MlaD family protein [Flavobacterium buctense]